ncbi:MAG: DUF4912 domain-containing protein [Elusimicrobiota bacterium]
MDIDVKVNSIFDENYCLIMPKNSETIFVFWKFSNYKISQFKNGEYLKKISIKALDESDKNIAEITLDYDMAKCYLMLPRYVENVFVRLYARSKNGEETISCSNKIKLSYEKEMKKEYTYKR